MDKLTAIRSFGVPSYTPAKGVRIYKKRWYMVTMQNTEHVQGDGYYLAEGEYTELVPGTEAKSRRDARLNHCNRIVEYKGPVYQVQVSGPYAQRAVYHPTQELARKRADDLLAERLASYDKAITACDRELAKTDNELVAFYGKCLGWPGNEAAMIAKHRTDYEGHKVRNTDYWLAPITIEQIR